MPDEVRCMRYRRLGGSGPEVSEISLGLVYAIGVEADHIRRCVEAALETGVTFFSTANAYGRGAAEMALGNILSPLPRDSYVLATKVWGQMSDDKADRGLSAAQIAKQIDASLRRLRVDHVDVYEAHRFDPHVAVEETVEALQAVVQQGKVRYLGFSEWTLQQINAAIEIGGPDLFVSSEPQYSLLWRAPEAELFPFCARHRISNVVWSPLAEGVLTGKYRPGASPPPGSRAAGEFRTGSLDALLSERTLRAVERLQPVADGAGLSMSQLALSWVLRRPEVASAIIGVSSPAQVIANTTSLVALGGDVLDAIDMALGDVPVTGSRLAMLAEPGITHRERISRPWAGATDTPGPAAEDH